MATVYLLVDSNYVIQHAQYATISTAPSGLTVQTTDDTATNVMETFGSPTHYEWSNGAVVLRPYFTLAYASNTVTATLNNPATAVPTSCSFGVAGVSYNATLTTTSPYTASIPLAMHPSLQTQQVDVTVSATGCVDGVINLGGDAQQVGLQVYTPSGGVPTVAPTGAGSKLYLQGYYASLMPVPQEVADIATLVGMTAHTLFDVVLPALSATVTLDANQQNTLNDLRANVMNHVVTTLENAAPVPVSGATQTYDPHYANVRADYPTVAQALEGYATDVATIPNLA